MGDDKDNAGSDKDLEEKILEPELFPNNILPFKTKGERSSDIIKKKEDESALELRRISERDLYVLKVNAAYELLTSYITYKTSSLEAMQDVLENLRGLRCKGNSKYKIGQAYLSILDEAPEKERRRKIRKIEKFAGEGSVGLLAHLVLLYDAEKEKVWQRVREAIHDQEKNSFIIRECKRLAKNDEYLEKFMRKYS